eukprot:gene9418-10404_t
MTVVTEAKWTKLNCRPVCYGAKGNSYGVFLVNNNIEAYQVKLERINGRIGCAASSTGYFNCPYRSLKKYFEVHVTDSKNQIIVPAAPIQFYHLKHKAFYHLNGNPVGTTKVVLSTGLNPYMFKKGEVYRVWYGEDLYDLWEGDNNGQLCVNVFALE